MFVFGPGFSPLVSALVPASSLFAAHLIPTAPRYPISAISNLHGATESTKVLTHNLNLQFIYLI
jgi:hypothetical protein